MLSPVQHVARHGHKRATLAGYVTFESSETRKTNNCRRSWPMHLRAGRSLGGTEGGLPRRAKRSMKRTYGSLVGLFATVFVVTSAVGCSAASNDSISNQEPGAEETSVAANELSGNALSRKQASTVLELVDDICGDTWCEGDHNFHFDQIRCSKPCRETPGTCRLTFRIFPYDSDLSTGPTYARTCTTSFRGFSSLVETSPNGYQSLNWDFYDALSACISQLEEDLPPI